MGKQILEIEMPLPTPNARANRWSASKTTKEQRFKTRRGLEAMAYVPTLPITVTLVRVSRGEADSDRAAIAMAAVRDELARWAHGIPEYVMGKNGKPRVPRAPDGPGDQIRWRYRQEKTKTKIVGYQAAKIIIEETTECS